MASVGAWIASARPKTLIASFIPVTAAAVLAASNSALNFVQAIRCFVVAGLVQIATNFFNDYYDSKKGSDTHERLGPKRALHAGTATAEEILGAAIFCLLLAFAFAIPIFVDRGWWLAPAGAVCLLMAVLYTGGPFALAYLGLGEIFVLIFFGWVATYLSYYVITANFSLAAFIAGTQIGCLSMTLITINNLRDETEDRRSRKRTLVVRFGRNFGTNLLAFEFFAPQFLQLYWIHKRFFFLPLLALPLAFFIAHSMKKEVMSEKTNRFLALSSLHALLFTICWSLVILF